MTETAGTVPCLTRVFYLRDLRFSAVLCVIKLFAVSVAQRQQRLPLAQTPLLLQA
jgi:hypothetical protein